MVRERAQVTLEACLIFVAIVLFLFGIMQVWLWLDVNIADRSHSFNLTRLDAGNNPDREAPILLEDYYTARPLTEDTVFNGEFSPPETLKGEYNGLETSIRTYKEQVADRRNLAGQKKRFSDYHKPKKDNQEERDNSEE